jgi:hypothetical protein
MKKNSTIYCARGGGRTMKRLVTLAATVLLSTFALSAETYGALASPGTYYGTGNSNTGWTISTTGNLELGLGGLLRFLGPLSQTGHVYTAPSGPTTVSGQTGSAWGFDFSANTGLGGSSKTLTAYDFRLLIKDISTGATFDTNFIDESTLESNFHGFSHPTTGVAANQGFQDSTSLHYFGSGTPLFYNMNAPDLYRITLAANDHGSTNLAGSVSIDVQVTPEPGTWLMLGTGLTAIGVMRRRSMLRN